MEEEAEVELWALWPWPWSCWWRGSGQVEPALRRRRRWRRRWRSLACCSRPALCATASTACHAARPGLSKASPPSQGVLNARVGFQSKFGFFVYDVHIFCFFGNKSFKSVFFEKAKCMVTHCILSTVSQSFLLFPICSHLTFSQE